MIRKLLSFALLAAALVVLVVPVIDHAEHSWWDKHLIRDCLQLGLPLLAGACITAYSARILSYIKAKLTAWRVARRAAKVALLADAIRAAQGPPS
jgi:hypothetical protein